MIRSTVDDYLARVQLCIAIKRELSNKYGCKLGRDYTYSFVGPAVIFEIVDPHIELLISIQFTNTI